MWTVALGAGWIAGTVGLVAGLTAALAGVALTYALHRWAWAAPLERLADRLEAAARGVELPPDPKAPRSGPLGGLFDAVDRVVRRAATAEDGDPWGAAARRLDAHGTSAVPEPLDPRFEAALERLVERERQRAVDVHRAAMEAAAGGVAVLDALEREQGRWRELADQVEAWLEGAAEHIEHLDADRRALAAARTALEERARSQADAERLIEESLRAASARLSRIAALRGDLEAGGRDLEQLERLVTALGRAGEPERRLEWVGEARATIAHWSESQRAWAAEAARSRDHLTSLASTAPSAARGPDLESTLEDALARVVQLTCAWSEHASVLKRLAASGVQEARARREDETRLRRGLSALAPLAAAASSSVEDALLERLRAEHASMPRATSSASGVTEQTERVLRELEARGARAKSRLEGVARAIADARAEPEDGRDPG
jgi:hypothetical protein